LAVLEIVREYVAEPNLNPKTPTPHRTGGAVDLTLVDLSSGTALELGTEFDDASRKSGTRWFEIHPKARITENRRTLFHALVEIGFVNYPSEWWHFEYGTRRWAGIRGMENAVYGGVS
jgi:zinc D-Ala-D-Ala dipeptidase